MSYKTLNLKKMSSVALIGIHIVYTTFVHFTTFALLHCTIMWRIPAPTSYAYYIWALLNWPDAKHAYNDV
jgi:hypothetical protein